MLALAADPDLPLLERVKLCAIASSNLDEFFAVRIARLLAHVRSGTTVSTPDGRTPAETLADCRDFVLELNSDQASLWVDGVLRLEDEWRPTPGALEGKVVLASYGVSSGPSSAPQARRPASMRSASRA